jgi:hypothetical protein
LAIEQVGKKQHLRIVLYLLKPGTFDTNLAILDFFVFLRSRELRLFSKRIPLDVSKSYFSGKIYEKIRPHKIIIIIIIKISVYL